MVQVSHDPVDGGQRRPRRAGGWIATRAVVPMTGRSATATVSSSAVRCSQDPAGAGTVVVLIPAPWSVVLPPPRWTLVTVSPVTGWWW